MLNHGLTSMSDSTLSNNLVFHDAGSYLFDVETRYNQNSDLHSPVVVNRDWEHNLIHEGYVYQLSGQFTLGAGLTAYFLGITDSLIVHFRAGKIVSTESPVSVSFYEDATVSANGTPVTATNKNRNSANTPTLLTYTGPTVTGTGTLLERGLVIATGAGNVGGIAELFAAEWVLDNASNYLISVTNNGSQTATINYNFLWYEYA